MPAPQKVTKTYLYVLAADHCVVFGRSGKIVRHMAYVCFSEHTFHWPSSSSSSAHIYREIVVVDGTLGDPRLWKWKERALQK
jgi:hypothetical protein